jgi:hypothetical protein
MARPRPAQTGQDLYRIVYLLYGCAGGPYLSLEAGCLPLYVLLACIWHRILDDVSKYKPKAEACKRHMYADCLLTNCT